MRGIYIKETLLFLSALAAAQALPNKDAMVVNKVPVQSANADDCETLENGCPVDFSIIKIIPHEEYCHLFYLCDKGELVLWSCPEPLYFDPKSQVCVWSSQTDCVNNGPYTYPTTAAPEIETTTAPGGTDIGEVLDNGCPSNIHIHHLLPHEECEKFYQCNFGQKVERDCAPGTVFNFEIQVCDWPHNVPRCAGATARPPTTPGGSSEEVLTPNDPVDWESLPNGCPVNSSIHHLLPHESDCDKFYVCDHGSLLEFGCAPGTHFSPSQQVCTWPHVAGCEHWTGGGGCTTPGSNGGSCGGSTADSNIPTTPVTENSTTPVPSNSTTPGSSNSTTPVPEISTTPDPNNSTIPSSSNSTTPVPEISTIPVPNNSTTPVPNNSTTPVLEISTTSAPDIETTNTTGAPVASTTTTPEVLTTTSSAPDSNTEGTVTKDPTTEPNNSAEVSSPADPELPGTTNSSTTVAPNCPQCPTIPLTPAEKCRQGCNVAPWAHAECDKYYSCIGNEFRLNICSEGLHFNPSTLTCDFICNAGCTRNIPQVTRHEDGILIFVPHSFDNNANLMDLIEHELNEDL